MQGGRGVKIVIFVALQCKVTKNPRKTEDAWGKSFSRPPGGPEEQRTYELRTRLSSTLFRLTLIVQGRYDRQVQARIHKEIQSRLRSDSVSAIKGLSWLKHLGFTLGISSNDAYSPHQ